MCVFIYICSKRTNVEVEYWVMGLNHKPCTVCTSRMLFHPRWILLTSSLTWSLCIVKDRNYVYKGQPRWWIAEDRWNGQLVDRFFWGGYTLQEKIWKKSGGPLEPNFLDDGQRLDLCVGLEWRTDTIWWAKTNEINHHELLRRYL